MRSSGVVRRALPLAAVAMMATLTACGGGGASGSPDTKASPSASPSASAEASPSESASATGAEPGSGADGTCGGGAFETKIAELGQGISVTVPADWDVESFKAGLQNRLYPPDREAGDGYLLVEPSSQDLQQAADDVLETTRSAAETTSQQDLDLPGFDGATMETFAYDESTFAVNVVAVYDGFRVQANMTLEDVPDLQPVVESCLSSIARGAA